MFERILMSIDAVSASLGLLRPEAKARPGVNPWGYAGGHEMVEKPRGQSFSSASGASSRNSDDSSVWSQEKYGLARS